jgi:hypothetical protein
MTGASDEQEVVVLPEGVSEADWQFERRRWQNPRIRHMLGCVRIIDEVMESNYAILHCSPRRLDEIWQQLRSVAKTLRKKVAPLLKGESKLAAVEEARVNADRELEALERAVLQEMDRFPEKPNDDQLDELRRFLCGALGRVQAFLLDALGQILAADPRSQHDADYFLARKFIRDVDEAEWLESSVARLEERLRSINRQQLIVFNRMADQLKAGGRIPTAEQWQEISSFLDGLSGDLTSQLKQVVGLRGIRVDELELLDQYSSEVPGLCGVLAELHRSATDAVSRLESQDSDGSRSSRTVAGLQVVHSVFSERMMKVMRGIDGHLRDLHAFTTLWLRGIHRRRALLLSQHGDE